MVIENIKKRLDTIVEAPYDLNNCPCEIKSLLKNSLSKEYEFAARYCYVVSDKKYATLLYIVYSTSPIKIDRTFLDSILSFNNFKLHDLIYFVTTFFISNNKNTHSLQKIKEKSDFFSKFLEETYGQIVYNHQFEQLYMLATVEDSDSARLKRKAIGKQEKAAYDSLEEIFFTDGKCFKNLLDERMVFNQVRPPNILFGRILYEYLTESN